MDSCEMSRVITALRAAGWDDKAIVNFILFVATGEERYKPKGEKTT